MTWPTNPGSRAKLTTGQRKLGEVAEIYQGGKSGLTKKDYVKSGFLAFSATGQDGFTKKAFDSGFAVILSSIGARCGKCFYAEGKWTALANTQVIKLDDPMAAKFLYYYLNDENKWPRYGSAQPFIAPSTVKRLKVPFPSLPIQKKIVERLDAIKKTQELNDKQLVLVEELFQSLLHRELDPKGKNWDFVKLGNVVQKIEYGLSVSVQNRLDENGVPILTMAEIENDGQINYQKTRKISASANELKKFKINKGELLFNWRNEKALIGKTGLFESEKDFIFASFLLRIVTNEKILPEFLWYWLNYLRTKNAYLQYAHLAGNQASYNANSLQNKISCPLILIKNQQKIVEKLSAVQEYKKKLLEQKQKLNELFESVLNKSMKRELIK